MEALVFDKCCGEACELPGISLLCPECPGARYVSYSSGSSVLRPPRTRNLHVVVVVVVVHGGVCGVGVVGVIVGDGVGDGGVGDGGGVVCLT